MLPGTDLAEIVYVDHYGNAFTGLRGAGLPTYRTLRIRWIDIRHARVFADAEPGRAFWYVNSMGLTDPEPQHLGSTRRRNGDFDQTQAVDVPEGAPGLGVGEHASVPDIDPADAQGPVGRQAVAAQPGEGIAVVVDVKRSPPDRCRAASPAAPRSTRRSRSETRR